LLVDSLVEAVLRTRHLTQEFLLVQLVLEVFAHPALSRTERRFLKLLLFLLKVLLLLWIQQLLVAILEWLLRWRHLEMLMSIAALEQG
jgi:hypothetical protein